jgi:hypothetical protein
VAGFNMRRAKENLRYEKIIKTTRMRVILIITLFKRAHHCFLSSAI